MDISTAKRMLMDIYEDQDKIANDLKHAIDTINRVKDELDYYESFLTRLNQLLELYQQRKIALNMAYEALESIEEENE